MKATIKLTELEVCAIIEEYLLSKGITNYGVTLKVKTNYGDRGMGDSVVFDTAEIEIEV